MAVRSCVAQGFKIDRLLIHQWFCEDSGAVVVSQIGFGNENSSFQNFTIFGFPDSKLRALEIVKFSVPR